MAVHPYVNFGGNCREAFTFYHQVFGGDLDIRGFDSLPDDAPAPPNAEGLVMHAVLRFGDDDVLLGSDNPFDFDGVSGAMVNYTVTSVDEARRAFDALSDEADVMMPFGETFFSAGFAMLVDRFGTPWMIHTAAD